MSLLSTWRLVKNHNHNCLKWHTHSPIFNNFNPITGRVPFQFPQWSAKGIDSLSDVWDYTGMRSFDVLCLVYNIPTS